MTGKLTILSVASSFVPLTRDACGGSEQIAFRLDSALVKAGHRSIMVACEASRVSGTLVPLKPITAERKDISSEVWSKQRKTIFDAIERYSPDMVHMHTVDFFRLMPPSDVRTLVTLHMPGSWYPEDYVRPRPNVWMNCVSWSQHQTFDPALGLLDPVRNGVPAKELRRRHARRNFLLNLGRICPEKGTHRAIDACRLAGAPLVVAGDVFPFAAYVEYMDKMVKPRLGDGARYAGTFGFDRKSRFLSAAKGVLIPVMEPETSCLVAMESISCGTPVIAFPKGAIPETVIDGLTGFLVNDEYEMAHAIGELSGLRADDCFQYADEHLSEETMFQRYLSLYESIVTGAGRFAS